MNAPGRVSRELSAASRPSSYRLSITVHTAASNTPALRPYGPWELSADSWPTRCRAILEEQGFRFAISCVADGRPQPLFPNDPFIAANRRVTITFMREEPPIPMISRP